MRRSTLAVLAAALLVVVACGDSGGDGTTVAGGGTSAGGEGVHGASTDLGTILVDAEGFTLYVFTNDTDGESTCYDACADLWPAVPADSTIGSDLDASMFGTTTRTDGSEQLTVAGQPLYRYTPDTNPGDTTGQGFSGVWFVVGVDGAMIGGPESATSGYSRADY